MTNFNEWEQLLISANIFVDVKLYYMLIKENSEITVRLIENVGGWEKELGHYPNVKESILAVEEYKERVEKLVKLEQDLF